MRRGDALKSVGLGALIFALSLGLTAALGWIYILSAGGGDPRPYTESANISRQPNTVRQCIVSLKRDI